MLKSLAKSFQLILIKILLVEYPYTFRVLHQFWYIYFSIVGTGVPDCPFRYKCYFMTTREAAMFAFANLLRSWNPSPTTYNILFP